MARYTREALRPVLVQLLTEKGLRDELVTACAERALERFLPNCTTYPDSPEETARDLLRQEQQLMWLFK
jgi:hypothetical protein